MLSTVSVVCRVGIVSLALFHLMPVFAQDTGPAGPDALELDPIVVVASKAPRPLSEVAGQVSVIDARQIEQNLLEGLDDLLRYEPGLNSESSGTRFGVGGVSIRGIGGNRVAMEVDGVPIRDGFATGSYSNSGRALIETGLVKRLEVLNGPASSLYGSDALGGVMAFTTWDPDDLLAKSDSSTFSSLRAGVKGEDDSSILNALAAWSHKQHGLLFSAARREGHEVDDNNPVAMTSDPQDWSSEDYFLRYTFDTPNAHRLRLTIEDYQRTKQTTINSILGFSRFRTTTAMAGDDEDDSQRFLIDYEFSTGFWDRGVARLFRTETRTRQLTLEERAAASVPSRYRRYFQYESDLDGIELNLFHNHQLGNADHRIGVGIEHLKTRTEELRDGTQQFLASGIITNTVLGETFPLRDFPNSRVSETGIFLQDEISLFKGWEIIPALRWDRYDMSPRADAVYLEDYPDVEIAQIAESQVSPRLGVVRKLNAGWSIYGQYVQGFRAPPHEDVNIGLDISVFRFRAIPNPDLRSETSAGFEIGVRQFSGSRRFSLAVFDTEYDDFIESRAPVGVDPDSGYLLFQSRNISQARIRGLDLRLEQQLGFKRHDGPDLRLKAALFWSEGDNRDNGQPLNTVSPPQAILGLAWYSADARWNASLAGTFTRRQARIDQSSAARFVTPGWSIFDLALGYFPNSKLELRFGIRNLTARHYWRWSDVARLAANDPMIQLLSQPGRHLSLSAKINW